MKTILFLHGFFASGSCVPANALREAFEGKIRVLTPDLPMHPKEALEFIHQLCDKEKPDFPGGHTPTAEEVKTWYVPLIGKMLMTFERPEERYFQHFKGGKVHPEKMFFGKVTRDGRTFSRFTEIDNDQAQK